MALEPLRIALIAEDFPPDFGGTHIYNLELTRDAIEPLKPGLSDGTLDSLPAMDEPDNLGLLRDLGHLAAQRDIQDEHFPTRFDLKE